MPSTTTVDPAPAPRVPPAPAPGPAPGLDDVASATRRFGLTWRATLLAAAVYAAYAIFLTWPLATNPGGLLPGPRTFADLAGSAAGFGYLIQHHIFPFAPATLHQLNAPEGLQQSWVLNWASFPSNAIIYALSYLFGAIAGAAVFLWLSFVLSGVSMFLLARRLFGDARAAFLAGFAFAFCPFAVNQIAAHDIYMDGFVLVAVVWRMLELAERPTARNALLAGGATALAMWWTPYFVLIGGVAFAAMALVVLAAARARGRGGPALRAVALAAVPILALLAGLGALTLLAGGAAAGALHTEGIAQLYIYSARAVEWLAPDRDNLVFGGLTRGYLTAHLHGSNFGESSLYLGVSVIVLAIAGVVRALRAARRSGAKGDHRLVAVLAGLVLAVVAALCSLPPTVSVLGLPLVTPSGFIFEFTSTWRDYSRFVELIELGLCIPLAFAAARLLARRTALARGAVFAALALVLVVDLWARLPQPASSAAPGPEYVWLAHHPGGIVADYPLYADADPYYAPLVWQLYDHHPLFQGYTSGSESETIKQGLVDLGEPTTAGTLAALGVRYVVVHPGIAGSSTRNLRRWHYVLRFAAADGSVWQVGAAPAPTRVEDLANFSFMHGPPGAEYRWLTGTARIEVFGRDCATCQSVLTFHSASNGAARRLTVTEAGSGAVLARVRVPAGRAVAVRVPDVTLHDGQAQLVLSTDIPPTYPPKGNWGPGSVTVREPALVVSRPAAS